MQRFRERSGGFAMRAATPDVPELGSPNMPTADNTKHHIDRRARGILDRLADDLEDDTLMTTQETARWLNVSTQFLEIGRTRGYGPPATAMAPKVVRYRKNAVLRWLIERERAYAKRMKAGA
jgi:hypothetical protein